MVLFLSDLLAEVRVHWFAITADTVQQAGLDPGPTHGAGTQLARAPFWRERASLFPFTAVGLPLLTRISLILLIWCSCEPKIASLCGWAALKAAVQLAVTLFICLRIFSLDSGSIRAEKQLKLDDNETAAARSRMKHRAQLSPGLASLVTCPASSLRVRVRESLLGHVWPFSVCHHDFALMDILQPCLKNENATIVALCLL